MNETDLKALFGAIDPTTLSQDELDRYAASWNDRPINDFCGLSAVGMDSLLYDPLSGSSPIRVRQDIDQDVFEGMPFLRLVEELVAIVAREEEIRLTATGALPPRFVHELYAELYRRAFPMLYSEEPEPLPHPPVRAVRPLLRSPQLQSVLRLVRMD